MKNLRLLAAAAILASAAAALQSGKDGWQSDFPVDRKNLGASGSNPYFVLTPGFRLHYAQGKSSLTTMVQAEIKLVDGIQARVVEFQETKNGEIVEVTRDYYSVDRTTQDVYYMGEDVDIYKDGKFVGNKGAWLSGVKGARFGLMMPGTIKVGQKFHQEYAPGIAMDRAEVVAVGETVTTPAGTFTNCVHMKETSPIEKGVTDHKWYAPGVGLIKDGEIVLVKIEKQPQ